MVRGKGGSPSRCPVWTGGHAARPQLPRAMSGMSQPPSSPVQGTVESLRLTTISLGAALSMLPVLASAGPPTGALPLPGETEAR